MKHLVLLKTKKAFFERISDNTGYWVPDYMKTKNVEIYYANQAIEPWPDMNVSCYKDYEKGTVFIWSTESFLNMTDFMFPTSQENIAFQTLYDEYYDKRSLEMPQVEISFENFGYYMTEWKRLEKELPKYVIVTLDKSGPLDKLEIVGKDELSEQDKEDIKRENTDLLRWKEADLLYNYDHDRFDDIWRSPADNKYDADVAKYLDRTEGFVNHRDYTKSDVIAELQQKLKAQESVHLIIHWLNVVRIIYGVEESDAAFDALLEKFDDMDRSAYYMISREKLQEIADRLSLGQDVVLD